MLSASMVTIRRRNPPVPTHVAMRREPSRRDRGSQDGAPGRSGRSPSATVEAHRRSHPDCRRRLQQRGSGIRRLRTDSRALEVSSGSDLFLVIGREGEKDLHDIIIQFSFDYVSAPALITPPETAAFDHSAASRPVAQTGCRSSLGRFAAARRMTPRARIAGVNRLTPMKPDTGQANHPRHQINAQILRCAAL